MIRQKYNLYFVFMILSAVVLNFFIGYVNINSGDYVSYGSVSLKKSVINSADNILSAYDFSDYSSALDSLNEEEKWLLEYREALKILNNQTVPVYPEKSSVRKEAEKIVGNSTLTDSQVTFRLEVIDYCAQRLKYATSYRDFIYSINNNVEEMSGISIFSDDVHKKSAKVKNDFYGLDNINVSAVPDIAINLIFSDDITDILVVVISVLCALVSAVNCHFLSVQETGKKYRNSAFAIVLAIGTVIFYISNIMIIDSVVRAGDLKRTVQSVSEYKSCPYMISVGTLIILRIAFKVLSGLIIYFGSVTLFLSKNKVRAVLIMVLFIIGEILLHLFDIKINFSSLFHFENMVGVYNNIGIMGEYVNSSLILSLFGVLLFIFFIIISKRQTDNVLLDAKEKNEKRYYDEINSKYTETRMLRHDMKNHLTAIAMLLDDGKTEDARKYLSEIRAEMDGSGLPVRTGSSVLDALMLKKLSDIKNDGITVNLDFDVDFSETDISEYDLCGIFGNIFDNAYEACKELCDEERLITMSVKRHMDMICIFCENKYRHINEDLSTGKKDKKFHGIGLRRIRTIAQKYNGTSEISFGNGVFKLSVLLNLQT